MMKKEKGIALISLLIVIAVMTIVASTVVYMSLDRFEINSLRKMTTDIELLQDKVSNYYLKYGVLPVLRDGSNKEIEYKYTTLNFEKNSADNNIYYILDLEAMGGISLNYGKEGFKNPNASNDVYIINEQSHTVYYVKGMELNERMYHSLLVEDNSADDTIPPSTPQIKVISGTKTTDEDGNIYYTTDVEIEIIPGKDGLSGTKGTQYSLDNGTTWNELGISSNVFTLSENNTYIIRAKSYDNAGNYSETTVTINIHIAHTWDDGTVTKEATCIAEGVMIYTCTVCGETESSTLAKDPDNHTGSQRTTFTEIGTSSHGVYKTYSCCGKSTYQYSEACSDSLFIDDKCDVCGRNLPTDDGFDDDSFFS